MNLPHKPTGQLIQIDASGLEEELQNDETILRLEKEKEEWTKKQKKKKEDCQVDIKKLRQQRGRLSRARTRLKHKMNRVDSLIAQIKNWSRFNRARIKKLDAEIGQRRRIIRSKFIRKAKFDLAKQTYKMLALTPSYAPSANSIRREVQNVLGDQEKHKS